MKLKSLSFQEAGVFSHTDCAYTALTPELAPFYHLPPTLEGFEKMITEREAFPIGREVLVNALLEQYQHLTPSETALQQITKLKVSHTFTIVTAHQPSLFTGPLYYIYKIISAINLSRILQEKYPKYQFVPVFWLGAEDHDFEEINHVKIFREKLVWENDEQGAVGQMSTKNLAPLIQQLQTILGDSESATFITELLHTCLEKHSTYGAFALELTHRLFEKEGLVVLDASVPALKRLAIPIFQKEILEQPSAPLVQTTQEKLNALGFKNQAFARPINLFYTQKGYRERIDTQGDNYVVLNQNISWTREEILAELHTHPERFSPNVIMRPLYQESILPNLAYIGGGGELAYWLERKSQFQAFGVSYPILVRRDSVLFIDTRSQKRMAELGINYKEIWNDTEFLIKKIVKKVSDEENNIQAEKEALSEIYQAVIQKLSSIDATLAKSAKGEMAKMENGLKNLENKMMRAEKRKHETTVNKIKSTRESLFPSGSLQERKDNFFPIYLHYGTFFLDALYQYLNPLDRNVKVIIA